MATFKAGKIRQIFSVIHSKFCVSVLCTLTRLAGSLFLFYFLIGKKWIYLERCTFHRQDTVHLRRRERPWEKPTPQSVGHLRSREAWRAIFRFKVVLVLLIKSLVH